MLVEKKERGNERKKEKKKWKFEGPVITSLILASKVNVVKVVLCHFAKNCHSFLRR